MRGLLRTDTEGVERQDAARASMIVVLVIVMAGFAYALLEAFAGLPRMTAAAPAAATALVRMIAFAWRLRGGVDCWMFFGQCLFVLQAAFVKSRKSLSTSSGVRYPRAE